MIYINDKLRISKVDDNCLQIEALKETTSKSTKEISLKWMWQGYYGDLRSAMLGVLKKQLFDTAGEEIQLKNIISRIESAEKNILGAKNKGDL